MSAEQPDPRSLDLAVTLSETPDGPHHEFTLRAVHGKLAAGSTVPDPQAALDAVLRNGEAVFFPQPGPPRLCTQQYGGPQQAVVTGTFGGRRVYTTLTLTDGCEIARWRALAPLLGGTAGRAGTT
ncbi:serine protease inhibitor [Arthrobacter sp. BHU FT2]|nr:serine protease inhibitor [Arthrobacter sp. BHU FT2]